MSKIGAFVLVFLLALSGACTQGGGSSDGSGSIVLLDLEFPDPSGQSGGDSEKSPQNASLVQQIVFEFNKAPDPKSVHSGSLRVQDENSFPVPGAFETQGNRVIFTPTLPTRPLVQLSQDAWDLGGAALSPGGSYFVEVVAGTGHSIRNLSGFSAEVLGEFPHPSLGNAVLASFQVTLDPTKFLSGFPVEPLSVRSVTPEDGAVDVAPFLYGDPNGVFAANEPIEIEFDGPIDPSLSNVSDATFQLVDLDDTDVFPAGLPLGVNVEIRENTSHGSRVRITPNGILSFGHLIAVEIPDVVRHLSDSDSFSSHLEIASVFKTQDTALDPVQDLVEHPFETTAFQDAAASGSEPAAVAADWDRADSNFVQAALVFPGGGELGRFIPSDLGERRTIVLDTSRQLFPLFDGSTPDAPPGIVVEGGVFNFTEIDLPNSINLVAIGPNPLVLTATGTIAIRGTIDLRGRAGNSDNSYDSAVAPMPGGPPGSGGGRGGDSHPTTFYPPTNPTFRHMITPRQGENGFTAARNQDSHGALIGGRGGRSGILDDPDRKNPEISCQEAGGGGGDNDRGRGSDGGGGSFLSEGTKGRVGLGNMTPNPDKTWSDSWPDTSLPGGSPGDAPFRDTDGTNNFIGLNGELKELQGGQGGGGGGSKAEGYHCGRDFPWGRNEFNGKFPDTVGDARGGGGGGGGGAFQCFALGKITVAASARCIVYGGNGGGGEALGGSNWGGGGGGGSGGAIVMKSADSIDVESGAEYLLYGGGGTRTNPKSCKTGCGGTGVLQFQVPYGTKANVSSGAIIDPISSWVDPFNEYNPVEVTPLSVAISRWIDVGRVIERAPEGTNPVFSFSGTDAGGMVITDSEGNILDHALKPFAIHYLGRIDPLSHNYFPGEEPRANWIPPEAEVHIEFQAADAILEGSKEVEPSSISPWSASPTIANGRQFIRFRITFDLTANGGTIGSATKRPVFKDLELNFEF